MKPEPSAVSSRGGAFGMRPMNCSKNSSSGEPGGRLGTPRPGAVGASTFWVVEMLTTAGSLAFASSAKLSGATKPAGRSGWRACCATAGGAATARASKNAAIAGPACGMVALLGGGCFPVTPGGRAEFAPVGGGRPSFRLSCGVDRLHTGVTHPHVPMALSGYATTLGVSFG